MKRNRGFTLIELLIVITILGLLATALLPNVITASQRANHFACRKNLGNIYSLLQDYKQQKGHYPTKGGVKFLLAPWSEGVCERSQQNRDYFFCAAAKENDPGFAEIQKVPYEDLWQNLDKVSSTDTNYAGRRNDPGVPRHFESDNECIAADDNEHGSNHPDKNVNVLFGSGSVRTIEFAALFAQRVVQKEDLSIPVGPASPDKYLRQVSKD